MKFFLNLIILIFLFLPSILALGVAGEKLSPIIFIPGKTIINSYQIVGEQGDNSVTILGDLSEYLAVSDIVNNQFDLIITFPNEMVEVGDYRFTLLIEEGGDQKFGEGAGAKIAIRLNFDIVVYSQEKDLLASLSISDVNEGENLGIVVNANSKSYKDIEEVKSEITIYDLNNEVLGTVSTDKKPLKSLESTNLYASFDASNLIYGDYWAEANVFFDGDSKSAKTKFKIGTKDILLKEHTKKLNVGYSEFFAKVVSNWGNELKNVYLVLEINGDTYLQTVTTSLKPWEEKSLSGITSIDLPIGEYDAKLRLFFEDQMKEENIKIKIIEKLIKEKIDLDEKELGDEDIDGSFINLNFFVVMFLLIVLIITTVILRKKYSEEKNEL
jgi:hypothetical protein